MSKEERTSGNQKEIPLWLAVFIAVLGEALFYYIGCFLGNELPLWLVALLSGLSSALFLCVAHHLYKRRDKHDSENA